MTRNTLLLLSVIAALVGCGGENPATPDGGMTGDAGGDASTTPDTGVTPDAPPASTVCDDERAVALTLGENTIEGDTSSAGRGLVLAECGSADAPPRGQEAITVTLPGTGPLGFQFTLQTDTTQFDTIVQVRPAGCTDATDAVCFDDASFFDPRSVGAYEGNGGDTVTLIVSGYGQSDEGVLDQGPWAMDVRVLGITPPTLTAATARRVDGGRFDFDLSGMDVEGDAVGARIEYLDATGAVLEFDGQTEFPIPFTDDAEGMTTFSVRAREASEDVVPAMASATQARISTLDSFLHASAPLTVAITDVVESGRGEVCDETHVCADAFECTAGTCVIPAAAVTLCAAAAPITLVPVGTTTTSTTVTGTVATMEGLLVGLCVDSDTSGAETLYTLTVPAAVAPVTGYDVVLDTENAATGEGDTVVYFQSTCGDPETTVECNDDIDLEGMNYASHVDATDVAAGTYTIAVEGYGVQTTALPFELEVGLRPVLATGTACDPAGVMNRCGAGACPAATMLCP